MEMKNNKPLRICLLSYRSNPHCGGQGVYIKNLSRALKDLGHHVEVVSGPPDPMLDPDIPVHKMPSLDLYNPEDPFRTPSFDELKDPVNFLEWAGVTTAGFPEPFVFGIRAHRFLKKNAYRYDIVHDNQCLSYGVGSIGKLIPTIATIHHPITVDRDIAIRTVRAFHKKLKHLRWYSFIGMQKRVSRTLPRIVTVSECAQADISREFKIAKDRFSIVPNGINTDLFYPMPEIDREPDRIIVTNSADTPLKGLYYLLQAIETISKKRAIKLVVIGTPKKNGGVVKLIEKLGIGHLVKFTGRIDDDEFVRQYARASCAVVPSVYEGFGLPVGEAMACGVPVISTTGGALPEVVGQAGMLVPPENHNALADAIMHMLNNPDHAQKMGAAGYKRVQEHFTWKKAAEKTVAVYRKVLK